MNAQQKFSKKCYTSGYWDAARRKAPAQFGQGSVVEPLYMKGYEAGSLAIDAGRAQRTMVWSTERAPFPLVRVTRTLVRPCPEHGTTDLAEDGHCQAAVDRGDSWALASCGWRAA